MINNSRLKSLRLFIIVSLFVLVFPIAKSLAAEEELGGDAGLLDHTLSKEAEAGFPKSIATTDPMPANSITNEEIVSGTVNGQVKGLLDDATNAVKDGVSNLVSKTTTGTNSENTSELNTQTERAKTLSGKLLSRLTKILSKEETLAAEKKTSGFGSTTIDEKINKIKQDINLASQKIETLKVDETAAGTIAEKTRIKAIVAEVKTQLQLVKDGETDLLSSLK